LSILGFTLIELLVVISIIGLLATLLMANFNAARSRARDTQRKADLRNIQTALRIYYNDAGRYPCEETAGTPSRMRACNAPTAGNCATSTVCSWGSAWSFGTKIYMRTLPSDPSPGRSYYYDQTNNNEYILKACLENTSDDKCSATTEAWCNTTLSGCLYIVQP